MPTPPVRPRTTISSATPTAIDSTSTEKIAALPVSVSLVNIFQPFPRGPWPGALPSRDVPGHVTNAAYNRAEESIWANCTTRSTLESGPASEALPARPGELRDAGLAPQTITCEWRLRARGLLDLDALDPVSRLAVALRVALADRAHDLHTFDYLAEDGVPVVEPGRRHVRDKELRPAGVRAAVGHREHAGPVVPQVRVELVADAVAGPAGSRARGVPALRHEALYDAVEGGPVEVPVARQEDAVVDSLRRLDRKSVV